MRKFFQCIIESPKYVVLFFLLIVTLVYSNVLEGPFLYDDIDLIRDNIYVHDLSFFPEYFTSNVYEGFNQTITNIYRPISTLSHAVLYHFFGADPLIFHVRNVLFHGLNGFLVFQLFMRFGFRKELSFLLALLFLVHPVHAESVSYIAGFPDVFHSTLVLLSLYFFASIDFSKREKVVVGRLAFILVLYVLALLTKESSVVLFPLLLLCMIYLRSFQWRSGRRILPIFLFFLCALTLLYLYLKLTIFTFKSDGSLFTETSLYKDHFYLRIVYFVQTLYDYFVLMVIPIHLYFERLFDFGNGGSTVSDFFINFLFSLKGIFGLFILIGGGIASYFSFLREKKFFLGFWWFLICLFPVSGIIVPVNAPYREHFLYLPIIGFFIVLAGIVEELRLKQRPQFSKLILAFWVIVFLIFGVRTFDRNFDWADPIQFFEHDISYSPNVPRLYGWMGISLYGKGELDLATENLLRAIRMSESQNQTYYYFLGEIALAQNDFDSARRYFSNVIVFQPDHSGALEAIKKLDVQEN